MLNQVESNLRCIVYLSTATKLMTDAEIEKLLISARNFNATQNVTGVLMYSDGTFIQYIEGTEDGLHKVYERIISSSREHKNIIEIVNEPIAVRNFPDWLMEAAMIKKSELFKLQAIDMHERFNDNSAVVQYLKSFFVGGQRSLHFSRPKN